MNKDQIDEGNGPAFPAFTMQYDYGWEKEIPKTVAPGMTVRDYFAAAALKSMRIENSDNPLYWDGVAKSVYACTDSMLKARTA